ncbi:hypothetical protein [Neopusillimonas maritima]|uniref:Uncharacterized protein n=1 Tax=Neopusillimonas maritima TaxID=2026239 RepID=A0A3A1YRA5_9BURK|nr:hypothetical protein [Neopusillimonas maritima]RIY39779.1 hypothetical protein CJP73_13135 [Neopusillimonas maritima]|tara:strand:- start:45 stop:593 length:549 start_codon:yes stop_codon:yes gene_type:complete
MSKFRQKQFQGKLYTFEHLKPIRLRVPLNATKSLALELMVEFGCHCFTEEFDSQRHGLDHKYSHKNEVRAFDIERYECSLHLPAVINEMQRGMIYKVDRSYTYAAHISLDSDNVPKTYSIFFSLAKVVCVDTFALKMFVKSAYLKPSVAKPNTQSWRFVSLAGQIAGAFPPKGKKVKPQQKK